MRLSRATEAAAPLEVAVETPQGGGDAGAVSAGEGSTSRISEYVSLFRRSIHLRYSIAKAISGLLPDFASGVVRGRLYRWAGFEVGKGAFIMGNLRLKSASPGFYDKLVLGEGVNIADNVTINLDAKVTLGRNVAIAPGVLIYTGTHKVGPGSCRLGEVEGLPVTIGDGAWIRLGAIIVPGVTIGRGSIVGAGAVVLKDVPENTFVQGNPAEVSARLPWGYR
jgi:acetyltransferase-like isoleucine patch superfamily enzyme